MINKNNQRILNFFATLLICIPIFVNEYFWIKYFDHDQYLSNSVKLVIRSIDILFILMGFFILFSKTFKSYIISDIKLNPPKNINFFNLLIFFIITSIALVFSRFFFLGYLPFTHGESEYAQFLSFSLSALSDYNFFRATWEGHHIYMGVGPQNISLSLAGFNFFIAWFFGIHEISLRIHSVLGGIIAIIFMYFLIKRRSNHLTALVAFILLVFNPYLITFQRSAYIDTVQVAFVIMGLFLIDKFIDKQKIIYLVLSGILFCISFLIKANSIIFIVLFLVFYYFLFKFKIRFIILTLLSSIIFFHLLYIDQLSMIYTSVKDQSHFSALNRLVSLTTTFKYGLSFYLNAYILYFELIIIPIILGFFYWRKIDNNFFKLLILFSFFYFSLIPFQGRSFDRYLEIGIITSSAALAFPISYHFGKRFYHSGLILLIVFISWNLYSHRSYITSIYNHIPYQYITSKVNELRENNRFVIYAGNSSTRYYFSPNKNMKVLPDGVFPLNKRHLFKINYLDNKNVIEIPRHFIKNPLNDDFALLLDTSLINIGDFVIITGYQLYGGEHAPFMSGYNNKGFRIYRHNLDEPNHFLEIYRTNVELQNSYNIIEKVYLSNNFEEIAALILQKKD